MPRYLVERESSLTDCRSVSMRAAVARSVVTSSWSSASPGLESSTTAVLRDAGKPGRQVSEAGFALE